MVVHFHRTFKAVAQGFTCYSWLKFLMPIFLCVQMVVLILKSSCIICVPVVAASRHLALMHFYCACVVASLSMHACVVVAPLLHMCCLLDLCCAYIIVMFMFRKVMLMVLQLHGLVLFFNFWPPCVGWLQGRVVHFLCCNPVFCKMTCIYMLLA
jgi:hypothetical protein